MTVTVEVVGEGVQEVEVDADATYADLVRAVGYRVNEVSVLVDGAPVPEDLPVEADRVTVLRLIQGGTTEATVRAATPDDAVAVHRVVDAALLAVDDLDERLAAGDVLVAEADGRVVGAIVLGPPDDESAPDDRTQPGGSRGAHIEGIAVSRQRRRRGVATALVASAVDRHGRVTADFRHELEPFWRSLGFAVEEREGRLWGVRGAGDSPADDAFE